jgi:hypothetical protein
MERSLKPLTDGFTKFWEHALIDFPFTLMARMFGDRQAPLRSKAWQAYDSWIALTNEATNQLYANRAFADASGLAIEASLRMQEIDFFPSATRETRDALEIPVSKGAMESESRSGGRTSERRKGRSASRDTAQAAGSSTQQFALTGTD